MSQRGLDALAQLPAGQLTGVDDLVRLGADVLEHFALRLDGHRQTGAVVQGVPVARLAEAPDERLVAGFEEEHLGLQVAALERAHGRAEREWGIAGAHVQHQRHAAVPLRVVGHQLGQVSQQVRWDVVHHCVAEVLEELAGRGFAGAGQARDDDHVLRPGRQGGQAVVGVAGVSLAMRHEIGDVRFETVRISHLGLRPHRRSATRPRQSPRPLPAAAPGAPGRRW